MILLAQSTSEWLRRGDWIGICLVLLAGITVLFWLNQKQGERLAKLMQDCTESRVENTQALHGLGERIKESTDLVAKGQLETLRLLAERFK